VEKDLKLLDLNFFSLDKKIKFLIICCIFFKFYLITLLKHFCFIFLMKKLTIFEIKRELNKRGFKNIIKEDINYWGLILSLEQLIICFKKNKLNLYNSKIS